MGAAVRRDNQVWKLGFVFRVLGRAVALAYGRSRARRNGGSLLPLSKRNGPRHSFDVARSRLTASRRRTIHRGSSS